MLKKCLFVLGMLVLGFSQVNAEKRPPFLITGLIPHLTMDIKNNWDNQELALNKEQKKKLLVVRKETISAVMNLKQKIAPLENEVAQKIQSGSKPEELMNLVEQISQLKVQATKAHLGCVYRTHKILSKKQLKILSSL